MLERPQTQSSSARWIYVAVMGLAIAAGLGLALDRALGRGLEYDEIWSLKHYSLAPGAGRIFSDLGEPNNHTLHSLLTRWSVAAFGSSEMAVRLPAFAAGLGLLAAVAAMAWLLTRSRKTTVLATAWCAASAPLVHYASTSRGYALQTLLIVGFVALAALAEGRRRYEIAFLAGMVIVGTAAVVLLPTSVLFLAPIGVAHFLVRLSRAERRSARGEDVERAGRMRTCAPVIGAYLLLGVLAAAWLLVNLRELTGMRAAHGAAIGGPGAWIVFCWRTLTGILGVPELILAAAAPFLVSRERRPLACALLVLVAAPLVAAPLTRAGPPRAYVPAVPAGLTAAAMGLAALFERAGGVLSAGRRTVAAAVLALVPLATVGPRLGRWEVTDWRAAVPRISPRLPLDVYTQYPHCAGYVIRHYHRSAMAPDLVRRTPVGGDAKFASIGESGFVTGANYDGSSGKMALPAEPVIEAELSGVRVRFSGLVRLAESRERQPAGPYLAAIGPSDPELVKAALKDIYFPSRRGEDGAHRSPAQWLLLNPFLRETVVDGTGREAMAVVLVSDAPGLGEEEMLGLERAHQGVLRFYALEPRGTRRNQSRRRAPR